VAYQGMVTTLDMALHVALHTGQEIYVGIWPSQQKGESA